MGWFGTGNSHCTVVFSIQIANQQAQFQLADFIFEEMRKVEQASSRMNNKFKQITLDIQLELSSFVC